MICLVKNKRGIRYDNKFNRDRDRNIPITDLGLLNKQLQHLKKTTHSTVMLK